MRSFRPEISWYMCPCTDLNSERNSFIVPINKIRIFQPLPEIISEDRRIDIPVNFSRLLEIRRN